MSKIATTGLLRYLLIALVGTVGVAGIIASGGGGGGGGGGGLVGTGAIDGFANNLLDGLGEDGVGVDLRGAVTPFEGTAIQARQTELPDGEIVASTRTDASGFYRFDDVPADRIYFLAFSKDGFLEEAYFEVAVAPATTTTLEPVPLLESRLDTVTGIISGSVADAATKLPEGGVTVRVRDGINNRIGEAVAETVTSLDGTYEVGDLHAGNYTLEASKSGFQTAYFDAVVLDLDGDPSNDITVVGTVALVRDELVGLSFSVSGDVFAAYDPQTFDPLTGLPTGPFLLGGAAVALREGVGTTVGTVTTEGTTDAEGRYSLSDVIADQYTLEAAVSGFNAGFIDVPLAQDLTNQNVTLMPLVSDGSEQITIVLTWGTETDLDGQLYRFDAIESVLVPIAGLNNDVDGFGPETTLLEVVDPGQRYEYFVDSFADEVPVVESGAQVRVYRGNNLIFTFNLPLSDPDAESLEWHVFTIEEGNFVPVNDLVGTAPSVTIDGPAEAVLEGDPVVFTVSLSAVSSSDIVLDMATGGGTATAGEDYETSDFEYTVDLGDGGDIFVSAEGPDGTFVTIPAGQRAIQVRVGTFLDCFGSEANETFELSTNAVISGTVSDISDVGDGTIVNNPIFAPDCLF